MKRGPFSAAISASVSRSSNPHPPHRRRCPPLPHAPVRLARRPAQNDEASRPDGGKPYARSFGDLRFAPSAPSALRSPRRGSRSALKHLGSIPAQNL